MTEVPIATREIAGLRQGTGISFGTFGELLQGALPGQDRDFLVTLPIMRWSTARITLMPETAELRVAPEHKLKSLRVANSVLAGHGRVEGGELTVTSQLAEGKGMASSSADLVATIRAVSRALDHPLTPHAIESFLRMVEPTDGLMYPDIVAYYHRRVRLCRSLAPPPPLTIVGVDEGGQVDTVRFNAARPTIGARERREYQRLLDRLAVALPRGDLATVGDVASRSARLNQSRCHKRFLDQLLDINAFVRGLGVVVAHSGTVLGILVDDHDPDHAWKVAEARVACAELAGTAWIDHTVSARDATG